MFPAFRFRSGFIALASLLALSLLVQSALADGSTYTPALPKYPFGKLHEDPTPVKFSVNGSVYEMPGNYLLTVDKTTIQPQTIVSLVVVYPGIKPFEKETKHCFETTLRDRSENCQIFEVFLKGKGSVASSDPEVFERWKSSFHSQIPIEGPYGFELYETGPDTARINTYRKKVFPNLTLMIQCKMPADAHQYAGVCDTSFHTVDGGEISIRFYTKQLAYIEDMVKGASEFVSAHTVTGDQTP